jgi:hypothetical protein
MSMHKFGFFIGSAAIAFGLAFATPPVRAGVTFSTYGDAALTSGPASDPVVLQLTSNTSPGYSGYAGIDGTVSGGLTLDTLFQLSAQYEMTTGSFNAGAPRFSINDTTNNASNEMYIYWGMPQSNGTFTDSNAGTWANTGNLADALSSDARIQINGFGGVNAGYTYLTYAQAEGLVGNVAIGNVTVDLDGGFAGTQVMITDDFTINGSEFGASALSTPEPSSLFLGFMGAFGFGGYTWSRRRREKAEPGHAR